MPFLPPKQQRQSTAGKNQVIPVQVPSACNYSQQQQALQTPAVTAATTPGAVAPRRRPALQERGNTAADISLQFGPPYSPDKPPPPTPGTSAAARRRRVTVVGAPPPPGGPAAAAGKGRPARASTVDERHPAAATAALRLVKRSQTSRAAAMTPVG